MKLIVGLGNEGEKYQKTYQNLGFELIDQFSLQHKKNLASSEELKAFSSKGSFKNQGYVLLKPFGSTNLSWKSIFLSLEKYQVKKQDLLILYNDGNLPLGKVKLKLGGGAGGHYGLKSFIEHFKNEDFNRLKIGIGKDPEMDFKDFVASSIAEEHSSLLQKSLQEGVMLIEQFLSKEPI